MFPIGVFQNLFGSNEILPFRASLHSKSILHLSDELWDSWSKSHKKTKSQVYISVISTLCIHTRNPGNLTPFSFLIGADFAWGSLKIPMQRCWPPTSIKKPFWYFSHCKYYTPSKLPREQNFTKWNCPQWNSSIKGLITFQKYITFVERIMTFLVKKSQKKHQVRSITELCIWPLYIPKTLGTIVSWHPPHSLGGRKVQKYTEFFDKLATPPAKSCSGTK